MCHAVLRYSALRDPATGELIDRGYVVVFAGPRSYTGEDCAELHVHGAPVGIDRVLRACCALGARVAQPGEFTWRAVLAGKLDLAQAEGLHDLLHAGALAQHRAALRHLDGELSRAIDALRLPLLHALADIEARIDFAAEPHLAAFDTGPLVAQLAQLVQQVLVLAGTARAGRVRHQGARVVLAGAPNAGKSTLLNALIGRDRAIVDARPGTTRDTLEVPTAVEGVHVTWIDTAGLRQTDDPIEQQGADRARRELLAADVVLWLVDQTLPASEAVPPLVQPPTERLTVRTKGDCSPHPTVPAHLLLGDAHQVSGLTGMGVPGLIHSVADVVRQLALGPRPDQVAVARQRHAEALLAAAEALDRAIGVLGGAQPALELGAADLRDAALALDELTGPTTPDDVLAVIFSQFCIGK